MSEKTVIKNRYATVRYNSEHGYIYHTFHGPISGEPFQNIMNGALDTLLKEKGDRWLSDDRKNAEFTQEDVMFAVGDWGPRASKGGWKYWALVVPESIAGRAGMTDIVQTFWEMGVRVRVFVDLEEAKTWIENPK